MFSEFGLLSLNTDFYFLLANSWSFFSFCTSTVMLCIDRLTQKAKLFLGVSLVNNEKCSSCKRKLFLFCVSHDSACMHSERFPASQALLAFGAAFSQPRFTCGN